jgi:hypothetical protein
MLNAFTIVGEHGIKIDWSTPQQNVRSGDRAEAGAIGCRSFAKAGIG